ncbi:tape measure protein [Limosilactobacillus reuteri]|uniref:Tape measure domain protein n=3 Tax=Limosilactobacillus reuteri TaxID=1598 RepID=A0A828RJ77_LIMRT|nr:tape measure protein [Limosilactobacillus reuteri]AYN56762.1 tail tape-measure protein [Lactobacillus phage LR2]EEI08287.1 tape measure domain protein [Limosilactobacillus reuteri MM2-3]EGC16018.1 tape measure domain protein [Limosilactobacillus reuteri MM4-1A]KRK47058.1 phage minor tail protein [Limosilactobacillus reuteri subsp. reuteri]MCC4448671.1 tape measure protein [Limosilactobacillus reuteri]
MDKLKVENEMATRISVDTIAATKSLSAFRSSISAATNAWKANETALKNSGQYAEAAKARISGLNEVIELQKAKISELKSRQEGLNLSNKDQLETWLKLDKDISQASKQLASYEVQVNRANSTLKYQTSGLAELQTSFRRAQESSRAYANNLRANGKELKANDVEIKGLSIGLKTLSKQYDLQKKELDQLAKTQGKNSEAYRKQKVRLDETSASIGKTKSQISELKTRTDDLHASLIRKDTLGSGFFASARNKILGIKNAEELTNRETKSLRETLKTSFAGVFVSNLASNAIMAMTSNMHGLIEAGREYNKEQDTMRTVWKSLTTEAPQDGRQLINFINDLSQHSIYSAETINKMAQSFYHVDSNVKHAKQWTNDFVRLGSTMHMTNAQIAEAGEQYAKIVAGGKASQEDMNVMINRFPMFGEAIQKATGKSMKQLQELSQQGKLTADDFVKAMDYLGKKYKTGQSEAMTSYMGMSMYLKSRFSKLSGDVQKSSFKMSKSAKDALVQVTSDKSMQRYANSISKALAGVLSLLSKTIAFMSKHQTAVKVFSKTMIASFAFTKTARLVTAFYMTLGKGIAVYKGLSSAAKIAALNQKMLNLAMKSNVIILVISAIAALIIELKHLYDTNKQFRKFINGIAKFAKSGLKKVGSFFKNTFKQISKSQEQSNREQAKANKQAEKNWHNFTNSLAKNWKSYWRNRQREQRQDEKQNQQYWNNVRKSASRGWKNIETSARSGVNNINRWYNNLNNSTSRIVRNMYRQHPKTFQSMYRVIQDHTRSWHDLVSGHWDRLGQDTSQTAKDMRKNNHQIFKDMYDRLNDLTGGSLGRMLKSWQDHMSQIGDAIATGKKNAMRAMADLANGVLKPFNTLMNDIKNGLNWILDKIGASKISGDWSISVPSYATGTAGNPDGTKRSSLALVNDGPGEHFREMYRLPNGQIGMFPNKRNFLAFLPKGISILNGEASHQLAKAFNLPRYANGVGDFFSGLTDKLDNAGEFIDKVIEHPIEALNEVFKRFVHISTPIKYASDLVVNVPIYIAKQAGKWIKKQFEELADPGGSGVERWRPYVVKALAMLHLSGSLVGKVLRQIQTESGGNPKAMGGTDGLADGHAMGLMQVKPGTFAANKLPGHGNIWNGFDNLLAGLNYARKRYGDSLSFLGQGHGYANGGRIDTEQFIRIAEQNKPEYVIPTDINKRSRAYQLLGEVIARFRGEEPSVQTTRDDQSIDKDNFRSLESKLDQLHKDIQSLINLGTQQVAAIHSQGKFDPKRQDILQAQRLSMKLNSF